MHACRFDPIQTGISLIQSRGRARQEDSAFVVLAETSGARSLAKLQLSEQRQSTLVQTSTFGLSDAQIGGQQAGAQIAWRSACQHLKIAEKDGSLTANPMQRLNEFKQRAAGEVKWHEDNDELTGLLWVSTARLFAPNSDMRTASATAGSKKEAKSLAALALLKQVLRE